MRTALSLLLSLAVVFALALTAGAEEGKEVKKTGKLVCGKCTLKECDACTNVLQVKEGDKTVSYFLKDEGNKASYHKPICPPGKEKEVTVTGKLATKDGKKWITDPKVEEK
jgi:hypothetical protein